jgi:hypothetical protein
MASALQRRRRQPGQLRPLSPADVIPFPTAANHDRAASTADWMARCNTAEQAERHLQRTLGRIYEGWLNRGVDPDKALADVKEHEAAIRAEVWRLVLNGGGQT